MITSLINRPLLLAVLSGAFFAFSWPSQGFWPLIFVAFVPIFILFELSPKIKIADLFRYSFLSFIIWNSFAAWWMCQYHFVGGVSVLLINALCMSCVIAIYLLLRKYKVIKQGRYLGFIALWLSWEWVQLHWDLSWPWLILGNGLASTPKLIQWVEYTGVVGGSLWILIINVIITKAIVLIAEKKFHRPLWIISFGLILFIVAPIVISLSIYGKSSKSLNLKNVLIVQQNTQPGIEATTKNIEEVRAKTLSLIQNSIDSTVDLVAIPETAILEEIHEDKIDQNATIDSICKLQHKFPKATFVIGATTLKQDSDKVGRNSKYNTAIIISKDNTIEIYHKSKLVPGVEEYPFEQLTVPLIRFLNGDSFDRKYSKDKTSVVFPISLNRKFGVAICYESVYGSYISEMPKQGAELLVLIANDGWWNNTDGYKQHLLFGNLRAIETRKSIVRAANTGISCVVDWRGEIVAKTEWGKSETIKTQVKLNNEASFYVLYKDYILTISNLITLLLFSLFGIKLIYNFKRNSRYE